MLTALLALVLTCPSPRTSTQLNNTVVAYGDSLFAGACQSSGMAVNVAGRKAAGWVGKTEATSGYTAEQIRDDYLATHETACMGERCGWVLFNGGVNDCKGGACDPPTVLAALMTAVDDALTYANVIITDDWPFKACDFCGDTEAGILKVLAYNALLSTACAARPRLKCVFFYSTLEAPAGSGNLSDPAYVCNGADKLHVNQTAADLVAVALAAQVSGCSRIAQ